MSRMEEDIEMMGAVLKPFRERQKGKRWSFRKRVFKRADGKCEICGFGVPDILNLHHIVPVAKGGDTEILNCILICPNCHALCHLAARILDKGLPQKSLFYSLLQAGIDEQQARAFILVGTERAMVAYTGEIMERNLDNLNASVLMGKSPASFTINVGEN